jgi:4'-phosphopantetheinyl transferase
MRCFTDEEINYINGQREADILSRFYEVWTLKESYIKAIGLGLSCPLRFFSVCINANGYPTSHSTSYNSTPYFFNKYESLKLGETIQYKGW